MNQQINFRSPILVIAFMKTNDGSNMSDGGEINPLLCVISVY